MRELTYRRVLPEHRGDFEARGWRVVAAATYCEGLEVTLLMLHDPAPRDEAAAGDEAGGVAW